MCLFNMELFCKHIPQYTVHQRNLSGHAYIEICISFFITQKKDRCISSIMKYTPTHFLFMQRFEVTVENKCMFCLTLIFIISDLTCTYVQSIVDSTYSTGCNPRLSFFSIHWSHLHSTSHT